MTDLLVIEFNTRSLDGLDLFDSDLKLNYKSYQEIETDFLEGISSGTCRIINGQATDFVAARIVCTTFNKAITTSTKIHLFFTINNPSAVTEDTCIPIIIYSLNSSYASELEYSKNNW